ncbi:MAG: hydrogenase expression/formation protein HypE [Anaerolineaceae bacterium]|nr:hydrogenase expression/formation protein HypE [Anaerolineaceae bacterium]
MADHETILLAHGGGGELSEELIRREILSRFRSPELARLADSAVLDWPGGRLAMSTDGYVVRPLFFRGGDIGRLCIAGTVNDLLMAGARPLAVSLGVIVRDGFPMADFRRILDSVAATAEEAGVEVVTGDTKTVDHDAADGIFLTTAGVGVVPRGRRLDYAAPREGDLVLVSGTVGDHGIAIMSERRQLGFQNEVASDAAPLVEVVEALLAAAPNTRCLKDPTRGGLAVSLNEIARACGRTIVLEESRVPVRDAVAGACDLLGLDVLTVANEGKLLAVVPAEEAEAALEAMRKTRYGKEAATVGRVQEGRPGVVGVSALGGQRIIEVPYGEELPRIC